MKKLYEKKEVLFAVLWIVAYCAIMTSVKGQLGYASPWMTLALAAIAAAATCFIRSVRRVRYYGLDGWSKRARQCLYFIPMFIMATGNLWAGVQVHYPGAGPVFAAVSMLLVGYVEEVIFRGFLFKAMLRENSPAPAIIVASVTFGIGHIVNLLTGQASLETVIQVIFAIAWGFMLTLAFYKGGSLWPCVAVHGMIDVFAEFSRDSAATAWGQVIATIVVALIYCPYLLRQQRAENHRA